MFKTPSRFNIKLSVHSLVPFSDIKTLVNYPPMPNKYLIMSYNVILNSQ